MRNPFRTEADAFRFVWLTIIYFALIVIASVINTWLGVGVFVGETAILIWWMVTHGRNEAPIPQVAPGHADGEHRILVVANETVGGEELLEAIHHRAQHVREQVLVVCPALNSPLKHWVSDEDQARIAAQERLEAPIAALHKAGSEGGGGIGGSRPPPSVRGRGRPLSPPPAVLFTT